MNLYGLNEWFWAMFETTPTWNDSYTCAMIIGVFKPLYDRELMPSWCKTCGSTMLPLGCSCSEMYLPDTSQLCLMKYSTIQVVPKLNPVVFQFCYTCFKNVFRIYSMSCFNFGKWSSDQSTWLIELHFWAIIIIIIIIIIIYSHFIVQNSTLQKLKGCI